MIFRSGASRGISSENPGLSQVVINPCACARFLSPEGFCAPSRCHSERRDSRFVCAAVKNDLNKSGPAQTIRRGRDMPAQSNIVSRLFLSFGIYWLLFCWWTQYKKTRGRCHAERESNRLCGDWFVRAADGAGRSVRDAFQSKRG